MKPSGQFTSIGGQAVIEGVMMRSPHFISVAVRKPDQSIVIRTRPYTHLGDRFSILKRPLLRGVLMVLESMLEGLDALSFSASVASVEESDSSESSPGLSHWEIVGSIVIAMVFGLTLFVAVPHGLTVWMTSVEGLAISSKSPLFHLLDGGLRMLILLGYVFLISRMKDIRRVFQYHGAEHKSIYAFEAREDLTVENARKHSTLHPRCGTSFLFFLVLVSVLFFSLIFPILNITQISAHPFYQHFLMVLTKIVLMFPVAGIAYEIIRFSSFRMNQGVFRILVWPGLALQKLTTLEPTDDQLEVALASLKQVLASEELVASLQSAREVVEVEVRSLAELKPISAQVSDFLER